MDKVTPLDAVILALIIVLYTVVIVYVVDDCYIDATWMEDYNKTIDSPPP